MTICVMKSYLPKQASTLVNYRNFGKFDIYAFRAELHYNLIHYGLLNDYETFQSIDMETFNKHAPIRQKYIRANNAPYMNKIIE